MVGAVLDTHYLDVAVDVNPVRLAKTAAAAMVGVKPTGLGLDKTAVAVADSQQYVAAQPPLLILQHLLLSCSFLPLDSDKSYTKHIIHLHTQTKTKKKG